MIKNLNDNNLLFTFKNTHNLRVMKFEIFRSSNYVSNFQKFIITCKWGVMCMKYFLKL